MEFSGLVLRPAQGKQIPPRPWRITVLVTLSRPNEPAQVAGFFVSMHGNYTTLPKLASTLVVENTDFNDHLIN